MPPTMDRPKIRNLCRRLAVLAVAVMATVCAPGVMGQEPILLAQTADTETPGETGLLNWLGNLLGRGLSTKTEPAAPQSQPTASPADSAQPSPALQPETIDNKAGKAAATPILESKQAQPVTVAPAVPGDRSTRLGLSLELGKSPPLGAAPSSCITKARETVRFCVEPAEWPEAMRAQVWVNSHMYQGTYGVVRYDDGRASYIHALIPTNAYDAVVGWYSERWGPPSHLGKHQVVRFNEPRTENPMAVWQRPMPDGGLGPTLEVRRFDDTRGGFADGRHGVILLYAPSAKPIFPQLSSVELMALRVVEDATERPQGLVETPAARSTAAASRPRSSVAPTAVPPVAAAKPTEVVSAPSVNPPPAPPNEANPFNPQNPVLPKLATGGIEVAATVTEAVTVIPSARATEASPPAAPTEKSEGLFSQLARFFDPSPLGETASPAPSPPPRPTPPRVDRTPDIRPPATGFFTRLIRTYTDDGSEIANIGETQPSRGQMLRDVPLAIDERLRLGMGLPTAGDGQQSQCFDKDKDAGNFCLIAPTWPPALAKALERSAGMPTVGLAALRFELGKVSHIQLRFAGDGFERIVAFFAERYGPPTERGTQRTTAVSENPLVLWRSVNSLNGVVSTLEIRRYDDLLPDPLDSRVGVIRVSQDNSAPLFPPLTSHDLSALR